VSPVRYDGGLLMMNDDCDEDGRHSRLSSIGSSKRRGNLAAINRLPLYYLLSLTVHMLPSCMQQELGAVR
jgi:hypothetical protein